MSSLSRKKGMAANDNKGMIMDLENFSSVTSDKYKKKIPMISIIGMKTKCFGALVLVLCTVAAWYLVLAPPNMVSAHKKIVNEKLEQLTVSIQKSTEMVTAEFEDLTKSLGLGHDELISKLESENKLLHELAETLKKETDAKHEEEIAKFKTNRDAEVAKLNSELASKQVEIAHLKDDISNNKDALHKVKAIIDKTKGDLNLFCASCPFEANGLKTTCGARKEYMMNKQKSGEDVAMEAVMTLDPNCKKETRS
eukprot:CAMPEP_0195517268 /NCGR_PEP_ID=MMETSP0794_2-20130614/10273_1 /TAXON_ID=515487 /ORGANISM="Stephanopyxis turris, Strain CCMP 815" /LENGTH=252 /DNA_ID=CAMNT_0040646043 /DNA_START=55 /DNA_END=813 /DNA_ORIENTATION=+